VTGRLETEICLESEYGAVKRRRFVSVDDERRSVAVEVHVDDGLVAVRVVGVDTWTGRHVRTDVSAEVA